MNIIEYTLGTLTKDTILACKFSTLQRRPVYIRVNTSGSVDYFDDLAGASLQYTDTNPNLAQAVRLLDDLLP